VLVEYAAEVCQKPGGKRVFWQGCWKALAPIPLVQLQTITQPTMIVWGAEDRLFPAAHGRLARQGIPHAQLELITRAGHVPFYDEPDIFNHLLFNFLGG
jgi:pimeloyl-ACP methyl ester carboxylesterase